MDISLTRQVTQTQRVAQQTASGTSYFLATRMGSWAKAINSERNAAAGRPQLPLETPPPLTPPRHFAADCSLHAAAGILLPILQTAPRTPRGNSLIFKVVVILNLIPNLYSTLVKYLYCKVQLHFVYCIFCADPRWRERQSSGDGGRQHAGSCSGGVATATALSIAPNFRSRQTRGGRGSFCNRHLDG